jgi:hypothetical protein
MFEYRIPIAEFVSAAVIVVCFLIALIVINVQASGRPRAFGVLGVVMLFLSAVFDLLNGSLGGAYGTGSLAYGVGSLVVAALAAGGLVLLALAVIRSRWARTSRGDR